MGCASGSVGGRFGVRVERHGHYWVVFCTPEGDGDDDWLFSSAALSFEGAQDLADEWLTQRGSQRTQERPPKPKKAKGGFR